MHVCPCWLLYVIWRMMKINFVICEDVTDLVIMTSNNMNVKENASCVKGFKTQE